MNEMRQIFNPARSTEVVGEVQWARRADVDDAVAAAKAALPGWSALSSRERFDIMAHARGPLDELARSGLAELLTREQGKVLSEAHVETGHFSRTLDAVEPQIGWLDDGEELEDTGQSRGLVARRPFGIVGVITPWNWPLALAFSRSIPALLSGNTVVLVVAPTAPLAAIESFRCLAASLPPGVVSVLTGRGDEVGDQLVRHRDVRKISFTGSVATGRIVSHAAAEGIKSLTLELGGNDPAILLDDVVLDAPLFDKLIEGTFTTTGQVCIAIKRLYVPEHMRSELVDGLADRLSGFVVGDGMDPETDMGPIHSEPQRRRVRSMVDAAGEDGAHVLELGVLNADPAEGWFMRPTLILDAENDAPIVAEEQFGPVLPILTYKTEEEAVRLANDTEFGLASSVWSASPERAFRVAAGIEAGTTWINSHGVNSPDRRAPSGGVKASGIGRMGGLHSLLESTEAHSITERRR